MRKNLVINTKDSVLYYPQATEKFNLLDETFLGFIAEENVVAVKIPSIISKEVLDKCGYFTTFPQHLTRLKPYNESTNSSERYLTPAACIHIYPRLVKECLVQTCYTTLTEVFRYENGMFEEPERLWEFSVREMVFVGTPNYVLSSLNKVKEKALTVARKVNESAKIVESNVSA